MPEQVEKHLVKVIRDFCWDGEGKTPISMDMMTSPTDEGGKRILDLVARNKAIEIMRVKSYLSLDTGRPLAAYVTDLIVNSAIRDPRMMPNVPANTFLQTFKVNIYWNSKLPRHVARMLKTAKDLGVRFEMAVPCVEVLEKIPIWHHFGTKEKARKMNNTERNICLRMNHGVEYVGEAFTIVRWQVDNRHSSKDTCQCDGCCYDHDVLHCMKPAGCVATAVKLLDCLQP